MTRKGIANPVLCLCLETRSGVWGIIARLLPIRLPSRGVLISKLRFAECHSAHNNKLVLQACALQPCIEDDPRTLLAWFCATDAIVVLCGISSRYSVLDGNG